MYVARNRQTPPENAFAKRRRAQAEAEAAKADPREPVEVAEQMPDLDALREAARRAAALVNEAEDETPKPDNSTGFAANHMLIDEDKSVVDAPAEPDRRGRPQSSTVAERTARILELITEAGSDGISKPALAEAVETKEANVYTSLRKLQGAGQVETRQLPDKTYRWFAV